MKKLRPSSVRTTPGCTEVRQIHQTRLNDEYIKQNLIKSKEIIERDLPTTCSKKEKPSNRSIQLKTDLGKEKYSNQKRPPKETYSNEKDLQKRPLLATWTHLSYPSMSTQQRFPATARVGGKARAKTEYWRVYSAHTLSRGRSPSVCVFVCVRVCVCV